MITGLRPATFENLQLNAGVFLEGFDATKYADASALEDAILDALESGAGVLGATVGGGSFVAEPSTRQIDADGMRYPVVGSTVNDMWTARLTGTLKEVTPENFKRVLMTCDLDESKPNVKVLTVRTDVTPEDYIPRLCWVGDTSKGFVMIELDNVLNMTGASFTFTDRGEGTLPFDFQAHLSDITAMDKAPFRIYFFDEAA
jgi:hypothetical protein